MKKISIAVLAVLILSGCTKQATQADQSDAARGKGRNSSPEASQSARPARSDDSKKDELKFKLESLDSSRREGTVTFTSMGAKTKVMIELKEKDNSGSSKKTASPSTAATSSAAMPAHIHLGSCPKPGEVKYPLTNVVNGASVTEVAASIDQMKALGALSVNVHKSATELSKYVACGNIEFKDRNDDDDKEGTRSGQTRSNKPSASAKASATARATGLLRTVSPQPKSTDASLVPIPTVTSQ